MTTYHELADAMRRGAALRPQAFGVFFTMQYRANWSQVCSCALGAVYEGVTGTVEKIHLEDIVQLFPDDALLIRVRCPADECLNDKPDYLTNVIAELNDTHRWTREAIADWLSGLEVPA